MEDAAPSGGFRRLAARGAVINSAFLVALGTLNLLKGVIVAGYLTEAEFGIWTILALAIALVVAVKAVTVGDKYIQQDEPDQELAFQKAFTLELASTGLMLIAAAAIAPLLVLAYGQQDLLLPSLALALFLPGLALQAPIWIYYRRMEFLHQRALTAVDPISSFVVTLALAAAGLGYWSLVIGTVAGAWIGGLVAVALCPYRIRLRFEGRTLREYVSFSWPLVIAVGAGLMIAQLSVFFGELHLGLAAAGAIGLAGVFAAYTDRIDTLITQALYPAICRVTDRRELLAEAFTKSNRLALMWGFPFGIALSLFAADLIDFGIGDRWSDALILLQVYGVTAAVNHIGFNWGAFYRAIGQTRPIAVVTVIAFVAFSIFAVPLLFAFGLEGFAAGIAIQTLVAFVVRFHYVSKLFPGFGVIYHCLRAAAPTLPAAAAVLALRVLGDGARTLEQALFELAVYLVVTVAMTLVLERPLLREVASYLRREPRAEPSPA